MVIDNIVGGYFEWMYQLVKQGVNVRANKRIVPYRKLLFHLHNIEFTHTLSMDENRAVDGVNLRHRFGYDCGHDSSIIELYLINKPCSVLEMMVALSLHCEEHYMDDPEIGSRLNVWFWSMILSLGLERMDDHVFDAQYTDLVIDKFLRREYKSNGEGGLFTIPRTKKNLTKVEIWYQMCWFLDSI